MGPGLLGRDFRQPGFTMGDTELGHSRLGYQPAVKSGKGLPGSQERPLRGKLKADLYHKGGHGYAAFGHPLEQAAKTASRPSRGGGGTGANPSYSPLSWPFLYRRGAPPRRRRRRSQNRT